MAKEEISYKKTDANSFDGAKVDRFNFDDVSFANHNNTNTIVSGSYKILDKDGVEMPDHWSGRRRTYEEAKKMVDSLNKNGEYRPYTMVKV